MSEIKVYRLALPHDDDPLIDRWILVDGDTPYEVIFHHEGVAKRAAELLNHKTDTGMGRFRTLYIFWKEDSVLISCGLCGGSGKRSTLNAPLGPANPSICSRCSGTGRYKDTASVIDISRSGGFEDRELDQVKKKIAEEIDGQIGFDRHKNCPEKRSQNGICESCPNFRRDTLYASDEDGGDVVGHRWMCGLRRDEVKTAEKLMEGRG
jgi:hypothetical protein